MNIVTSALHDIRVSYHAGRGPRAFGPRDTAQGVMVGSALPRAERRALARYLFANPNRKRPERVRRLWRPKGVAALLAHQLASAKFGRLTPTEQRALRILRLFRWPLHALDHADADVRREDRRGGAASTCPRPAGGLLMTADLNRGPPDEFPTARNKIEMLARSIGEDLCCRRAVVDALRDLEQTPAIGLRLRLQRFLEVALCWAHPLHPRMRSVL